jgi:hypothetical protein
MTQRTALLLALASSLALALLAAALTRAALARQDDLGDQPVELRFERVEHTVTLPPDHNARATYGFEPRLIVRRRDQAGVARLLDKLRPRVLDALQQTLAQVHFTNFQRGDGREELAARVRDALNGILGGPYVIEVQVPGPGR